MNASTATETKEKTPLPPPDRKLPKLGLHSDMPNETYHRAPGISASGLKAIQRSPAHYKWHRDHPTPPTPAMQLGTAFHSLVLEPDTFDDLYVVAPEDINRRTTIGKEQWAEFETLAVGKTVLKAEQLAHLTRMRDAVMSHPFASILLDVESGPAETSGFWINEETKKLCKFRPDKINEPHFSLIDLKTAVDASYSGFAKAVSNFGYMMQAAWYLEGARQTGLHAHRFVFIAVEKEPPYGIGIYSLGKSEFQFGDISWQHALTIYAECHDTDTWPCYPPEPRVLTVPAWGLRANAS